MTEFVPRWLEQDWPLGRVRHIGRDLTWSEWAALPDITHPNTLENTPTQ